MQGVLLLDVEAERQTARLREVGLVLDRKSWHWVRGGPTPLAEGLQGFAVNATAVAGHNIIAHDIPLLAAAGASAAVDRLPVIDTLVLSPLSHPQNPYHRLIKDYKLVREAVNDPVADSRLAGRALVLSCEAFAAMPPDRTGFHAWCLRQARFPGGVSGAGMADLLERLGAQAVRSATDAAALFEALTDGRACRHVTPDLARTAVADPERCLGLAYLVAWMSVTEAGDSIIPLWVLRSVPQVRDLLRSLRDTPCTDPGCTYCRQHHDAIPLLQKTFGFPAYRAEPAAPDGGSLQQRIVEAGLRNEPTLAILPTGGGKSLCFQVPALARFARCGVLTVVISPLQALMRDQVENLEKKTGATCAAALSGMLTPPERADVLERVRMGSIGLLYISPEQLRNRSTVRALSARHIGAWVFDEAHCLSKWGHDFRPDYLYAVRFIKEKAPAPVTCVTATAKQEVVAEIRTILHEQLGQELTLLPGGVRRTNLTWSVQDVGGQDKTRAVLDLLAIHLDPEDDSACAVIYGSTRGRVRDMAAALRAAGMEADYFHAGRSAREKAELLEHFSAGRVRIICATNAFGMGIDKDTVRLVIHADIPGSLENYLQEAGRAGRDGLPAHCALLYDARDIDAQFRLSAFSEVAHKEISGLLRALRQMSRRLGEDRIITTPGELIEDDGLDQSQIDTKVKTGVAWLEKADLLRREENDTSVLAGRPSLSSLEEAERRLAALPLAETVRRCWKAIYRALVAAAGSPDEDENSLSTDTLCTLAAVRSLSLPPERLSSQVMAMLNAMEEEGLVEAGTALSALVKPVGLRAAFDQMARLERAMLDLFREAVPEAEGHGLSVGLRHLAQRLRDAGHTCEPDLLRRLLKGLDQGQRVDGRWFSRLRVQTRAPGHWRIHPFGTWGEIVGMVERRQAVCAAVLDQLIALTRSDGGRAAQAVVRFTIPKLTTPLKQDMLLAAGARDLSAEVEDALIVLHGWKLITLQQGLAVFRQAMTIDLHPDRRRKFTNADYAPLAQHYQGRIFQVHVMAEYARLGLSDIAVAEAFANDYFALSDRAFEARYLKGREADFRRPLTPEDYARIVTSLKNRDQQDIVTAPAEANLLVLAGPGSGKTRVIVHRVAWLLKGLRVPGRSLLVLCYNRAAAVELRCRLRALVGEEAAFVDVFTYHGLAMRLIGASFAREGEQRGGEAVEERLKTVIPDATALLEGRVSLPGLDPEDVRDRLLSRYRTILIDEYQDIDGDQYALVSAIAGRQEEDQDARIALMAVGDDDQSIYGFRKASVAYIRRFEEDYGAKRHYLVETYRSTRAIVDAANQLIGLNRDRLKTDHRIRVDKARSRDPLGGRWQGLDAVGQGRVGCLEVPDARVQAMAVLAEIRRLRALDPGCGWSDFAVLSPTHRELTRLRALCEAEGVPVAPLTDEGSRAFPLSRLREVQLLLAALEGEGDVAVEALTAVGAQGGGRRWSHVVDALVTELADATPPSRRLPRTQAREIAWDALAQMRRDRPPGDGVVLSTLHGAKGLEFPHVLLLDADRPADDVEEERRLFYVGMTRARQTLTLLCRDDTAHPRVTEVAGHLLRRRLRLPPPPAAINRQVALIGLEELFLDWAGRQPAGAPAHTALRALCPGAPLVLVWTGSGNGELRDSTGTAIACLSAKGDAVWRARAGRLDSITLHAVVTRTVADSGEDWRARLRCDRWEVPVAEVWWHADGGRD
ncbi:RecQ family ATP-dependent DNA helicase [Caenispirillum bisanense]